MRDFWEKHFDKILLSALFLIALGTFMHFARAIEFYGTASNSQHLTGIVTWLENTVGQILAALLTLMVGRSIATAGPAMPANGAQQHGAAASAAPAANPPQK